MSTALPRPDVPVGLAEESARRFRRDVPLLGRVADACRADLFTIAAVAGPEAWNRFVAMEDAVTAVHDGSAAVRERAAAGTPLLAAELAGWAEHALLGRLAALAGRRLSPTADCRAACELALVAAIGGRRPDPVPGLGDGGPLTCEELLALAPADDVGWEAVVAALVADDAAESAISACLVGEVDAVFAPRFEPAWSEARGDHLQAFIDAQGATLTLALGITDAVARLHAWSTARAVLAGTGHRGAAGEAVRAAAAEALAPIAIDAALDLVDVLHRACDEALRGPDRVRRRAPPR